MPFSRILYALQGLSKPYLEYSGSRSWGSCLEESLATVSVTCAAIHMAGPTSSRGGMSTSTLCTLPTFLGVDFSCYAV